MRFYTKMELLRDELVSAGHTIYMPSDTELSNDWDTLSHVEQVSLKQGFIDTHVEKIKKSDAILVANYDKSGQVGYIGANTFMEIAFAYILQKKIYLINNIPSQANTLEIEAMSPIVLGGDVLAIT